MKNKIGLRETIAQAKTPAEINDLLVIGTQFETASEHTKRRWKNTARTRLVELHAGDNPAIRKMLLVTAALHA